MTSSIFYLLWGILAGMAIMGLMVWFTMPLAMIIKKRSKYPFDETIQMISDALGQKPDWKVLAVNDYQKSTEAFTTLEKVCSVNICNPRYAARILTDAKNRFVTTMMPLAIGVYEDKKGQVHISMLNVSLMGKMFGGSIAEVMGSAGQDIQATISVIEHL